MKAMIQTQIRFKLTAVETRIRRASKLDNEITETRVAAKALNRMNALGRAQFERVN